MPRNYSISPKTLRVRHEIIWSLHLDGHDGQEIAELFNMERSWISRIVKQMPKGFKSVFVPVVK